MDGIFRNRKSKIHLHPFKRHLNKIHNMIAKTFNPA